MQAVTYDHFVPGIFTCRIRTVVVERKASAAIDVDGSYLYTKHKDLTDAGEDVAPLQTPSPPPCGWLADCNRRKCWNSILADSSCHTSYMKYLMLLHCMHMHGAVDKCYK